MTHSFFQASWAALGRLLNLSDSLFSFIKSRGLISFLNLAFKKYFMATMTGACLKGLLIYFDRGTFPFLLGKE